VLKLELMFLSPNPFSQLNLLQDLKLGAKRRRGAGELESTFTEGLVEWK
jgi:CRISPR/Cas system CSM-associated protein Csm4 (group 5 of RAMP superfamily)